MKAHTPWTLQPLSQDRQFTLQANRVGSVQDVVFSYGPDDGSVLKDDEVFVEVKAVGISPLDLEVLTGSSAVEHFGERIFKLI